MKRTMIMCGLSFWASTGIVPLYSQVSMTAQVRTRSEYRDGQGAPLPHGAKAALFTSQRTRLAAGFQSFKVKAGITLQDVRVWGQDVSTINRIAPPDANGILLHEAWGEIQLSDTIATAPAVSVKLGRQELVYDDQRLLGNLDWLQQGRRHDAIVLKYAHRGWMLHIAAAFNQNKEQSTGTLYNSTPPGYAGNTNGATHYKSMQFIYAGKKWNSGNASWLLFADQFSRYSTNNSTNVKILEAGTWARYTTGFYVNNTWARTGTTASAYYQFGTNSVGQQVRAALLSGAVQHSISKKLHTTVGIDYTSGGIAGNTSKAFDPLYGTPHKFWGLMDYFYVANPFGQGGLINYFLKTRYVFSPVVQVSADFHQFSSVAGIPQTIQKNLGQELDLVGNYNISKQFNIEAGVAHFFSTPLLTSPAVKNIPNAKSHANWAYVMVNIKPEFFFK